MQYVLNAKTQRGQGASSGSESDFRQPRQGLHLCRTRLLRSALSRKRTILQKFSRAETPGAQRVHGKKALLLGVSPRSQRLCPRGFVAEVLVAVGRAAPLRLRVFALKSLFLMEKTLWQSN
jgi:hypothetical protein